MSDMPARYQPDPWIDTKVTDRAHDSAVCISLPTIPRRDWLGLAAGDGVGVAPADARSVWVGRQVPRILGEKRVCDPDRGKQRLWLPAAVCEYLDAEPGDTIRFHNCGDGRIRVERRPRAPRAMGETDVGVSDD